MCYKIAIAILKHRFAACISAAIWLLGLRDRHRVVGRSAVGSGNFARVGAKAIFFKDLTKQVKPNERLGSSKLVNSYREIA